MTGNVWEWTADWYDSDYYANSSTQNPQGPESGDRRVLRGGGFSFDRQSVRSAYRAYNYPLDRFSDLGFRVLSPGL